MGVVLAGRGALAWVEAKANAAALKERSLSKTAQDILSRGFAATLGMCRSTTKRKIMVPKSVAESRAYFLKTILRAAATRATPTK